MRYIVAAIIGLPKPGTHVPIHLRVEVRGESEVWIRHFGKQRMVTHQWLKDNLLIEAAGPFRIGFKLTSDSTGLKFQFNRCWFLALPIPDFLSPKVNAIVHGYPDRWHVDVSMESPLLGLLSRYEGEVAPE